MARKIVLVGHCGPDSAYLRIAVSHAAKDAQVVSASDQSSLDRLIDEGVDLILFNRELGYGYSDEMGVDAVRRAITRKPTQSMILVSNHPDVQTAAEAAGARPGFGKREIGTNRVIEVIRAALEAPPG